MSERLLLTPRQLEFLALVAQGMQRQEIAVRCYVVPKTVADTLDAARMRLGARTLAHAVAIAMNLELIVVEMPEQHALAV